jgi:HemX protein
MVLLLHTLALGSYLAAGGIVFASFAADRAQIPRSGAALLAVGVLLHAAALFAFSVTFDELPLIGLAPSLTTLAFLIAAFLLIATPTGEARPVALVVVPLVALLLAISLLLGLRPAGEPLAFRGVWFAFHVVLAFIGYAGFAIAAGAGFCYLLQFRQLKSKRFGRAFRFFPALPTLDGLARRGVAIGFPALTLAIALGWAWAASFREALAIDGKVAWAVLTWALLGAVLLVRRGDASAGRRGALLSVVGFAIVVAAYLLIRVGSGAGRVFL